MGRYDHGVKTERLAPQAVTRADLLAWHCLMEENFNTGATRRRPGAFADFVGGYTSPPSFVEVSLFVARRGGELVGAAQGVAFREDNDHILFVDHFAVDPSHHRRGVGTAVMAEVVREAHESDRSLLIGTTQDSTSGDAFCRAFGAEPVQGMRAHRLELASVDPTVLSRWCSAGEALADYELVGYDDACPDEWVAGVVDLLDVMNDAPRGGMDSEDHVMTATELRDREAMNAASGRRSWWLLARHRPTGQLVGLTELSWHPDLPEEIAQGDTGVRPAHRGHGLGKWLKAAMLVRVLEERPVAIYIDTNNGDSNAPMLAINQALGFRAHAQRTMWQLRVEVARRHLEARGW